ncbi:UDP-glucose 6-dehydrogenase [Natrarchaeobaculum aegyptiacum]|uniref:UDP-N-acetyl-D-mannosamine dehydrogenase n=1 Tax=Natrarchaeobaculum aegyptiacum TaxID=745377 RepID=A0A2Z2HWN9_9EURY|nr:UDP-glucose 6-dehydrogenase [Natrarchaeobaculum aegyptiacum]
MCVHGLGYVGLPTAAAFAASGHEVVGYDVDETLRAQLAAGEVHVDEPELEDLVHRALDGGTLTISDEVVPADFHLVCVPTPFDEETTDADLSAVRAAGTSIADVLEHGDTVVLESTVPPRTTTDVFGPILEESGLGAGEEFHLAYAPETVLPGNVVTELLENDRIVGGVDADATDAAASLYDGIVDGEIHRTHSPTVAEFVKLVQNTYRDVNVALANELATIAADYGVDSRETIALANNHPRVDVLQPGPGVGGHCLPIDPWFLGADSDRLDLIERARAINEGMVAYVGDLLEAGLGSLEGAKIAVLGVAYKGNVGDPRKSPGLALARHLQERTETTGSEPRSPVEVALHDPYVTDQTIDLESLESALDAADGVAIVTDHDEYERLTPADFDDEPSGPPVVVDSRAILDTDRFEDAGYPVRTI